MNPENKNPVGWEADGVLEKIDDLNQILNYLPASRVKLFFSLPGLGDPVPELRTNRTSAMQTSIPIISIISIGRGRWSGWNRLVWIVGYMMCWRWKRNTPPLRARQYYN